MRGIARPFAGIDKARDGLARGDWTCSPARAQAETRLRADSRASPSGSAKRANGIAAKAGYKRPAARAGVTDSRRCKSRRANRLGPSTAANPAGTKVAFSRTLLT